MSPQPSSETKSKLPLAIVIVLLLLAGNLIYGAILLMRTRKAPPQPPNATAAVATATTPAPGDARANAATHVGIAYGTEKERWLKWAVGEFAKTPEASGIKIDLIPMGSLEGAQAINREDQRINVWSPASRLYREQFEQDWTARHGTSPIAREERLALTPMVFVMWDERYQAFVKHYGDVSFHTVGQALAEPSGWAAIANQPDWGLFKFSHTVPSESNSGLAALVTMAYDFHNKSANLQLADALNVDFQKWLGGIERGASGMQNSTGNMMKDMVLLGPSTFDCLFVYESVVIDYLDNANGRWGHQHVTYPKYNSWNDNPYYILDVPWSTAEQRKAAEAFLTFLMSEPAQRQAMKHGFRPGNPAIPTNDPDGPWTVYRSAGLTPDLPGTICEPPKPEVIFNLLQGWERTRGGR
jgi:Ca-activated chloride channel family protein